MVIPSRSIRLSLLAILLMFSSKAVSGFVSTVTAASEQQPTSEEKYNKPTGDKDNSKTNSAESESRKPEKSKSVVRGSSTRGSSSKGSSTKRIGSEKPQDEATKQDRAAARKRGDITFDDLAFDAEKDERFENEMLTDEIKELDKRKIKIRGYILPTSVFQQKGIEQFILVRDNQECCFGPGAAIYDCVVIDVIKKGGAKFTTRPVTVTGKFEIDTETYKYPDGPHFAIYKMSAIEVE